jgi:hypothetical protein
MEMGGINSSDLESNELLPTAREWVASPGKDSDLIFDSSDSSVDFEAVVNNLARKNCLPDEFIFKNNQKLVENPFLAATHVQLVGDSESLTKYNEVPAWKAIADIAKIQAAGESLGLDPKQKEFFEGVNQNKIGALAFVSGMVSSIRNSEIRKKVFTGTLLVIESGMMAACGILNTVLPTVSRESITYNTPPLVQATDKPQAVDPQIHISTAIPQDEISKARIQIPIEISKQIPLVESDEIIEFEDIENALHYMESNDGAKWLPGKFSNQIANFPKSSTDMWNAFSNLESVGNEPHYVLLIPSTNGEKVSVIGVEVIDGKTYLDFIDSNGKSTFIRVRGLPNYRQLQGIGEKGKLNRPVLVWPDLDFPDGDCGGWGPNPVTGVEGMFDGKACSIDGKGGHYFQYGI